MTIVRWNPLFRELSHLQDRVNQAFGSPFDQFGGEALLTAGAWVPPVDIYQNGEQELVLKAELPGLSREEIEITVDKGTLWIKGDKKLGGEVKEEAFHRVERHYGAFSRSFHLPNTVDPNRVAADFQNGVLTVRLPLREEAKPRQVKIEVAAA
jgi:HSP20 family protein